MVIIRAAEEYCDLQLLQCFVKGGKILFDIFLQAFIAFFGGQLPQGADIIQCLGKLIVVVDLGAQGVQLLQQRLCCLLIVPKAGGSGLLLQPGGLLILSGHIQSFLQLCQPGLGLFDLAFPILQHSCHLSLSLLIKVNCWVVICMTDDFVLLGMVCRIRQDSPPPRCGARSS